MLARPNIGMPIDKYIGMPISSAMMTHDELIRHYGTQKAAGEALKAFDGVGAAQSTVAEWKVKGIPAPRQAQYELLTGGALRADRAQPHQVQLALPTSADPG